MNKMLIEYVFLKIDYFSIDISGTIFFIYFSQAANAEFLVHIANALKFFSQLISLHQRLVIRNPDDANPNWHCWDLKICPKYGRSLRNRFLTLFLVQPFLGWTPSMGREWLENRLFWLFMIQIILTSYREILDLFTGLHIVLYTGWGVRYTS